MSDSILKRYASRTGESLAENRLAAESSRAAESESLEEFAAFGILRGIRDRATRLSWR